MERELITVEDAIEALKEIKGVIEKRKVGIVEASKIAGFQKSKIDNFMKKYKSEKYDKLEAEVREEASYVNCSNYAKRRLEGNMQAGTCQNLKKIYEDIVKPSFELKGKDLEEYKKKFPLIDFESITKYYNKKEKDELKAEAKCKLNPIQQKEKDEIIRLLNLAIKTKNFAYLKKISKRIKSSVRFQRDEELKLLLEKTEEAEEMNKEEIEQNKFKHYLNKRSLFNKVDTRSPKYDETILLYASMEEKEFKTENPEINYLQIQSAAKKISRQLEGNLEEKERVQRNIERAKRIRDVSEGNFIDNEITTQEKFEKYYEEIPSQWTRIKRNANKNWNKFLEYSEKDNEELNSILSKLKIEQEYAKTYNILINKGIRCDFWKLKEKRTIEELNELVELVEYNQDISLFNNLNATKTNPLCDIIVDSESTNDYKKISSKERTENGIEYCHGINCEANMIKKILKNREKQKLIESIKNKNTLLNDSNLEIEELNTILEDKSKKSNNLIENENQIEGE